MNLHQRNAARYAHESRGLGEREIKGAGMRMEATPNLA
jgi:hypothetical protein